VNETQGNGASHVISETHSERAKQATGLDALFELEKQPAEVLVPKTNPKCEIRVFRQDEITVLEWWTAGRMVDEIVIKDEMTLYWKMRYMAEDNRLCFNNFWKEIKHINGMNTNKASAIFNYIGLVPKFRAKMSRITNRVGVLEMRDWCLIFEPLYESDEEEQKSMVDPETMRKYWKDLLG